ncbi:MAG: DUF1801 domain-containing protein [Saprospiraceae bacterium]
MKKLPSLTSGISEPEKVNEFMSKLNYPLIDVVQHLRTSILNIDKEIGEGIAWNAPTFFYTGFMPPFNPKDYKRYLVGINIFKQDYVRLIFLRGAFVEDPSQLLEGSYADGRRLALFKNVEEVKNKEEDLKNIILHLLHSIGN